MAKSQARGKQWDEPSYSNTLKFPLPVSVALAATAYSAPVTLPLTPPADAGVLFYIIPAHIHSHYTL